jgi:SAM-dependent methyltransferase
MVAMAVSTSPALRYQFKAARYSSHTLLLAEFPQRGEGRRVLDVGCSIGFISEILAARGYAVTSVDWPNSPHPSTVEFAGADLDNGLPDLQGKFDYIICADVLEHLRAPLELLKECRGRLAPGGALVGSLPNSGHAYFRWQVLAGRFPQHERGLFDSTHLHFYTWDGWVDLFGRAGLRMDSVRGSGVPVGLAFPRWDGSLPVRMLERLSLESAGLWKRMFAYQFIVRARSGAGAESLGPRASRNGERAS